MFIKTSAKFLMLNSIMILIIFDDFQEILARRVENKPYNACINLFRGNKTRGPCSTAMLVCTCSQKSVISENEFSNIFTKFWPYSKIEKYLKYIAASYPQKARLTPIATTVENRTLYSLSIGVGFESNNIIFVNAGFHARDWSSIMMALYIIYALIECDLYEKIGYIDWMIIPVSNPDGYVYSFNYPEHRMWIKNRSPCPTKEKCSGTRDCGVDLNKNFEFMYSALLGSSINPCANVYSGGLPASELETQAITSLLREYKLHIKLYISLHSHGTLFAIPFAHSNKLPHNQQELQEFGMHAINAINSQSSTNENYTIGNYANLIVSESGSPVDFVKGMLDVQYTYSIYLRGGFDPPVKEILPMVTECFCGICTMAKEIYNKHPASKDFLRKWRGFKRRRKNAAKGYQLSCGSIVVILYIVLNKLLLS